MFDVRRWTAWLLPALVGITGCAVEDRPANLVLITLDTTRADHLGCYGDVDAVTPQLDRIAAEGVRVEHALTVAPLTLPSHASLFTGLYPPQHGVRDNADFRLPENAATLAEHLRASGYATGAVVGSYVLSADFGLDQGFETYDEPRREVLVTPAGAEVRYEPILERTATEVTDRALEILASGLPEPFFLWVHYFDPHKEYEAPEPYAGRFGERAYAAEIAYTDAEVGRLLEELRRRELLDRSLLAITADHGESLGEHGENTHGLFVYGSTLRIPLLLRHPGRIPAGGRVEPLVSLIDLAPTVLELLELPPLADIEGRSFATALDGTLPEREPAYAEALLPQRAYGWSPLFALQDRRWKLIEAPVAELYDLAADPDERTNLAGGSGAELDAWRARLETLRDRWPAADPQASRALDPAERARLRSLGYVSADAEPSAPSGADPKERVALHNDLLDAQSHVSRGRFDLARTRLRQVLEADPTNPAALALSGTLACSAGSCDEGIRLLEDAAARAPGVYETRRNLANALHLAGRLDEAESNYRAALELQPFAARDHYALGNVLFGRGRPDEAVVSYDEAVRLGLDSPAIHAALGAALRVTGQTDRAEASLQRAVERDPGLAGAWNELGILAEQSGDLERAGDLYVQALEVNATHAGALFNLAKVSLRLGRADIALEGVERLSQAHPQYPSVRFLEAQVRLARGEAAAAREALRQFLAQPNADPRLKAPAQELLRRLDG